MSVSLHVFTSACVHTWSSCVIILHLCWEALVFMYVSVHICHHKYSYWTYIKSHTCERATCITLLVIFRMPVRVQSNIFRCISAQAFTLAITVTCHTSDDLFTKMYWNNVELNRDWHVLNNIELDRDWHVLNNIELNRDWHAPGTWRAVRGESGLRWVWIRYMHTGKLYTYM